MTRNLALGLTVLALFAVGAGSIALSQSARSQSARSARVTPPPVPPTLEVSSDFKPFLLGHGIGTQNYVCRPSGSGFAYVLFTPQAALFDDDFRQLTSHFFSPNPFEANTDSKVTTDRAIRVTWQDSRDSSTVWAKLAADPVFVTKDAVPWLKLEAVNGQNGPDGGDRLTETKFIQRVNTFGGVAPSTGCASLADVGNEAFVPYRADYVFYKKAE